MVRILKKETYLDDEENTLRLEPADIDGFYIEETVGKNKVYVYYTEIETLIQLLRKIRYDNNNSMCDKHSTSSAKNLSNANLVYKTNGDTTGFKDYNRYIRSNDWKKKRDERVEYDGNRCRNCGSRLYLQVHHRKYNSLGKEDVKSDLVTLCDECHDKITKNNRKNKKGVVTEFS